MPTPRRRTPHFGPRRPIQRRLIFLSAAPSLFVQPLLSRSSSCPRSAAQTARLDRAAMLFFQSGAARRATSSRAPRRERAKPAAAERQLASIWAIWVPRRLCFLPLAFPRAGRSTPTPRRPQIPPALRRRRRRASFCAPSPTPPDPVVVRSLRSGRPSTILVSSMAPRTSAVSRRASPSTRSWRNRSWGGGVRFGWGFAAGLSSSARVCLATASPLGARAPASPVPHNGSPSHPRRANLALWGVRPSAVVAHAGGDEKGLDRHGACRSSGSSPRALPSDFTAHLHPHAFMRAILCRRALT